MVTDFVSFGDCSAQDARVKVYATANDVEGGFDVSFSEDIEKARGILWMRAVIEGECDVFPCNGNAAEGYSGGFREIA